MAAQQAESSASASRAATAQRRPLRPCRALLFCGGSTLLAFWGRPVTFAGHLRSAVEGRRPALVPRTARGGGSETTYSEFETLQAGGGAAEPPEELVNKVLDIQRSSLAGREQWVLYCNKYFGGAKDPRRHDSDSLRGFLEHFEEGYQLGGIVSALRAVMEHSPAMKKAWAAYTRARQSSDWNVHAHREASIIKFLDALNVTWVDSSYQQAGAMDKEKESLVAKVKCLQRQRKAPAQAWDDYCATQGEGTDPNPAKMPSEMLAAFLAQHAPHMMDPELDELVQRVKTWQRENAAEKELWVKFVDRHVRAGERAVYDPLDHDKALLKEFLESVAA